MASDLAVWVVLPTYNERENLPGMVGRITAAVPAVTLLIVDDNSPDGTGDLADSLAADDPRVRVLHRPGKAGYASAYRDGFARAIELGADVVVQLDADGSHDPATVPAMIKAIRDGNDLAVGSRYVKGSEVRSPLFRRAGSVAGNILARLLLGSPPHDWTGGFRAWRAPLLASVLAHASRAQGYAFTIESAFYARRAKARIADVPITFVDREAGRSKLSVAIALEEFSTLLRLRFGR